MTLQKIEACNFPEKELIAEFRDMAIVARRALFLTKL